MDIPRSAVAAARSLVAVAYRPVIEHGKIVDYAGVPGVQVAPGARDLEITDEASALAAITPEETLPGRAAMAREITAKNEGVDLSLPPILHTMPVRAWRGRPERFSPGEVSPEGLAASREVYLQDGLDPAAYGPLVERPARAGMRRPGLGLLPHVEVPATPAGAHALTAGILAARLLADRVESQRWLDARETGRARGEADAYRAFADAGAARLSEVFSWLTDQMPTVEPVSAFPTVPAVVRGYALPGVIE